MQEIKKANLQTDEKTNIPKQVSQGKYRAKNEANTEVEGNTFNLKRNFREAKNKRATSEKLTLHKIQDYGLDRTKTVQIINAKNLNFLITRLLRF